ncbi:hypothetical protein ABIC22_000271 [Paenibacillus sp. PvP094]
MFSIVSIFAIIFNLVLYGLGVYALILFIKLAQRGIQALDIYLSEKRGERFRVSHESINHKIIIFLSVFYFYWFSMINTSIK